MFHLKEFSVAFIIGDSQSQYKLCGRYLGYANVPRICRACDVTPEESDNPYHECRFLSMADINAKSRLALDLYKPEEYGLGTVEDMSEVELNVLKIEVHNNLKKLSQHMHINAFRMCGLDPILMVCWKVYLMTCMLFVMEF